MTVRCLNKFQKAYIIRLYRLKKLSQKELAQSWNVSERTINRVLIEAGIATPVERIKGEANEVIRLLKQYGMNYNSLKLTLETLNAA